MINKKLKKELLKKLNITPSRLSQKVKKIKIEYPLTTDEAVYIIAQQAGIPLDKYLNHEELIKTRNMINSYNTSKKSEKEITKKPDLKKSNKKKEGIEDKDIIIDPLLTKAKVKEGCYQEYLYRTFYAFENSIREFVDRLMKVEYGNNWWDKTAKPEIKKKYKQRIKDDDNNPWLQKRSSRKLDYLDLTDLKFFVRKAVQKSKDIIPDILPSLNWFEVLVDEVSKCRNIFCHMSKLDNENRVMVENRYSQWKKQIEAKKKHLE